VQDNHFSVKPGNVREFDKCQGNVRELTRSQDNVRELSGKRSCWGKLFIVNIIFGAIPVYIRILLTIFVLLQFWCIAWCYYTVITVVFHYYAVSVHGMGNRNLVKSMAKCHGNVREFHSDLSGHPWTSTQHNYCRNGQMCCV